MRLWGLKLTVSAQNEGLEAAAEVWERLERDWVPWQQEAESGDGRI